MNKSKARKPATPAADSFETAFRTRLDKIEEDAKAIGANMTIVCKQAGVSRAGPVRWRNEVPHTIKLMDRLSAVVEKLTQKKAAKTK
jgi:hypothetical protein